MNVKNQIFLQLLSAKGQSVSGEELARQLGVSRAAIWKAVQALRADGCEITSATNRGYTLLSAGNMTDEESLSAELKMRVIRLESTPSTNTYALGLNSADRLPVLVIADVQTRGKARHGENFPSPRDEGLYMTYLFFPRGKTPDLKELNFAAADIVASVTGGTAHEQEIFMNSTKIAGVLVESTADPDGITAVAVGIGVYTSLFDCGKNQRVLILELVKALRSLLETI